MNLKYIRNIFHKLHIMFCEDYLFTLKKTKNLTEQHKSCTWTINLVWEVHDRDTSMGEMV